MISIVGPLRHEWLDPHDVFEKFVSPVAPDLLMILTISDDEYVMMIGVKLNAPGELPELTTARLAELFLSAKNQAGPYEAIPGLGDTPTVL